MGVDLDIRIEHSQSGLQATASLGDGATYRADVEVDDGLSARVADFANAIRSCVARDVEPEAAVVAIEPTALARQLGGELFHAVIHDQVLRAWVAAQARSDAGGADDFVRIRIQLDGAPELALLPWELLFDGDLDQFVALSNSTPIVRHLALPQAARRIPFTAPLRVLALTAAPDDLPHLDSAAELGGIKAALADIERVELRILDNSTIDQLRDALRDGPWHVFHFIGHGDGGAGRSPGVALRGTDGHAHMLDAGALAIELHDEPALLLVVLNACRSAAPDTHDIFQGVAQQLIRQRLPAVVAMQFAVTDQAAVTFATELYRALADRLPVDRAAAEARKALFALGSEWATPVVHLGGDGAVLSEPLPPEQPPRNEQPAGTVIDLSVSAHDTTGTVSGAVVRDINIGGAPAIPRADAVDAPVTAQQACKSCGRPLQPGAAFCPHCGTAVALREPAR